MDNIVEEFTVFQFSGRVETELAILWINRLSLRRHFIILDRATTI